MNKQIAMILSGCGHKDGTELTEAVSALLALNEVGARVHFFAPDDDFIVKDPLTGQPTDERRNVMRESARIARGNIRPLTELRAADFDAVVLPGGFGAATNLSDWAAQGDRAEVHADVARALREFFAAQKPIGAICIAPTLVARTLGREGVTVTIGREPKTVAAIQRTGATHEECAVDDFISDRDHRVVTTPAYMYGDAEPFAVYTGIRKAMRELVEMA